MTKAFLIFPFILIFGLLSGLFMAFNFVLIEFIGMWAIYTSILTTLLTMYFLIKSYKFIFKSEITILTALLSGIPIYIITLSINEYFYHYGGTVVYSDYGKVELVKETFFQALGLSVFLSLIFLPIQRRLSRKKGGHVTET